MRVRRKHKKNFYRHQKAIFVFSRLLLRKIDAICSIELSRKPGSRKDFAPSSSFLKRDVLKKEFTNPYRKKKVRLPGLQTLNRYRLRIAEVILLILGSIWFGFLFFTSSFYYSSVLVEGAKDVSPDAIEDIVKEHLNKRSFLLIKRSHMLFFRSNPVEEAINEQVSVEQVTFDRDWATRSITVHIQEKLSTVLLGYKDDYYSLDDKGVVIRHLDSNEAEERRLDTPIIYDYTENHEPALGNQFLSGEAIQNVITLYQELKKYPDVHIHSFRLKPVEAKEVHIPEQLPSTQKKDPEDSAEIDDSLDDLAKNIAQAKSTQEKLNELRGAIDQLEIKHIQEGEAIEYIETEKVYTPDPEIKFDQLEVYMHEGWTLKLGHEIIDGENSVQQILKVFATLSRQISIKEEVREYIDLRFKDRVYYR